MDDEWLVGKDVDIIKEAERQADLYQLRANTYLLNYHILQALYGNPIMEFEPLEDRILIRPDDPETQKGLIHIPESYRRKPQIGTVIAVPKGIRNHDGDLVDPLVSPGDRILFAKYTGTEIIFQGCSLIIMREGDILGKLHNEQLPQE